MEPGGHIILNKKIMWQRQREKKVTLPSNQKSVAKAERKKQEVKLPSNQKDQVMKPYSEVTAYNKF